MIYWEAKAIINYAIKHGNQFLVILGTLADFAVLLAWRYNSLCNDSYKAKHGLQTNQLTQRKYGLAVFNCKDFSVSMPCVACDIVFLFSVRISLECLKNQWYILSICALLHFILNGVNREPWGFFLTQFLCICALHHNCFVKAQRSDSRQSHIPLSISFNPQKEMSWYRAETALCDAKEGKQSWCCFRVML